MPFLIDDDGEKWRPSQHWRTTPTASSPAARQRMQATRSRDTRPEILLRRQLHGRGLRFRVNRLVIPSLRRRADLVFGPAKVAVFVDGCYWHGCPQHMVWPKENASWWREKIATTKRRDADTDQRLVAAGWICIRVWEHEDTLAAADRIEMIVRARRAASHYGRLRHSCATLEIGFAAVLSGSTAVETPETERQVPPLLLSGRVRMPALASDCSISRAIG